MAPGLHTRVAHKWPKWHKWTVHHSESHISEYKYSPSPPYFCAAFACCSHPRAPLKTALRAHFRAARIVLSTLF